MTDDEKLALLSDAEALGWSFLVKTDENTILPELLNIATFIERCQRIRANLGVLLPKEIPIEKRDRLKRFWRRSSFSSRVSTFLGRASIDDIQLAQMTNDEILRTNGLGEKTLWEIRQQVPDPMRETILQ